MLTRKGLLAALFSVICISIFAAGIHAFEEWVYINIGDGPVQSASIVTNNGAHYNGTNSTQSGHSLWIDLQRKDGTAWINETTSLMPIGTGAYGISKTTAGTHHWRVQLNPQYWFRDCIGSGKVF